MWKYNQTDNLYSELTHSDINTNEDYLMHYGILGMKWRHHKNPFAGIPSSHATRKYSKQINRLNNKLKGTTNVKKKKRLNKKLANAKGQLAIYKQRDKNRLNYAKNTNAGKSALKTMTFGLKTGNYDRYRSAGYSRVKSYLLTSLHGVGDGAIASKRAEKEAAYKSLLNKSKSKTDSKPNKQVTKAYKDLQKAKKSYLSIDGHDANYYKKKYGATNQASLARARSLDEQEQYNNYKQAKKKYNKAYKKQYR